MVVLMGGLGAIHSFSSHPKVFIHICAWMTEDGRSEGLFGLWRLALIETSTNQIDCSRQLICLLPKRTALLEAIDSVILEFCLIEAAFRLILREALILAVPSISHLIRYPLQVVTNISHWSTFFINSILVPIQFIGPYNFLVVLYLISIQLLRQPFSTISGAVKVGLIFTWRQNNTQKFVNYPFRGREQTFV